LEEKQNNLYIPANIKTRLEFFKGFGIKESVTTIIVVAFSLPIIYLIYLFKGTLISVVCLFIIVAGTIIANTKDDNNLCVVDQLKFMIRKSKMQKVYKYKYIDKWRR
jgi:hypothetical protein